MTAYPIGFLVRTAAASGQETTPGTVTAQADAITLAASAQRDIFPLSNDTSSDGTPLSISSIVTQPARGTLTRVSDTQLRYTAPDVAGTYNARIAVRSGSGGSAESAITFTVTAGSGEIAGLAVPWGGGQIGNLINGSSTGTWEAFYGRAPTAIAGWTDYKNMTTPAIFGGGSIGSSANWGTFNEVFNNKWNYHIHRAVYLYGTSALCIWVFPGVPTDWSYKKFTNVWSRFKSTGTDHQTWKDMWYAVGRRTAAMIDRLNGTYANFIMDVGWEMTNLSYDWSVGNKDHQSDYKSARQIAVDNFRLGARAHAVKAETDIRWMMRVSANKTSGELQSIFTGNSYEPIIGRSWHENHPDNVNPPGNAVSGTGRPWHKRTGWTAEQSGTWGGHKLNEVADYAIAQGCKIGMSEVGHSRLRIPNELDKQSYEMPSISPVSAVDKIFTWCKKYEDNMSHWCWLHSTNRPMLPVTPTAWAESMPAIGTTTARTIAVANRIRDVFKGDATAIYKDYYSGD